MLVSGRLRTESKCISLSMSLHIEPKYSGCQRQTQPTLFTFILRLELSKIKLTHCLCHSSTIRHDENSGSNDFSRTTGISRSWSAQSEILGKFDSSVCSPSRANTNLKCRDSSRRVFSPRIQNTTLAAVSNLLVKGVFGNKSTMLGFLSQL